MINTLFIGKVCRRFEELTSTNDYAFELISRAGEGKAAKSKPPEGMVVWADNQTAGRGQFGSRWESTPGKNLTFSVILYPIWLEVPAQFYLSMAMALGLRDAVASPGPPGGGEPGTAIKWPNDLYLGNRKAAGILIQNTISGQYLQASVVGIGLNVNQLEFDPGIPNPTSLALAQGRLFDLESVAGRLFECLEQRYLQLKSDQRKLLKTEYEQCLYRLGEPVLFRRMADDSEFSGTIRGVTETGMLKVETASGEETFEVKEIRFL